MRTKVTVKLPTAFIQFEVVIFIYCACEKAKIDHGKIVF